MTGLDIKADSLLIGIPFQNKSISREYYILVGTVGTVGTRLILKIIFCSHLMYPRGNGGNTVIINKLWSF